MNYPGPAAKLLESPVYFYCPQALSRPATPCDRVCRSTSRRRTLGFVSPRGRFRYVCRLRNARGSVSVSSFPHVSCETKPRHDFVRSTTGEIYIPPPRVYALTIRFRLDRFSPPRSFASETSSVTAASGRRANTESRCVRRRYGSGVCANAKIQSEKPDVAVHRHACDERNTRTTRKRKSSDPRSFGGGGGDPFRRAHTHSHVGNSYDQCARSKPTKYFRTHKYTCTRMYISPSCVRQSRMCVVRYRVKKSPAKRRTLRSPPNRNDGHTTHFAFDSRRESTPSDEYVFGGDTDHPENPSVRFGHVFDPAGSSDDPRSG